jgi:hypothetical protein
VSCLGSYKGLKQVGCTSVVLRNSAVSTVHLCSLLSDFLVLLLLNCNSYRYHPHFVDVLSLV